MHENRHNLEIDELLFQKLLAAAFTIQEYNDGRLTNSSAAHSAEPVDPLNLTHGDADSNLQGADAAIGEALDSRLLEQIENLLKMPALAMEGSDSSGSKEAMAQDMPGLGFMPELYQQQEQMSAGDELVGDDKLLPLDLAGLSDGILQHSRNASDPPVPEEGEVFPDHLLPEIVEQALRATNANSAAIALKRQGKLIYRAVIGDPVPEIGAEINVGSSFTGTCASSGNIQFCSNTTLDRRVDSDACSQLGVRAIMIAPIIHGDRVLALVAVFSRRPYAFGTRDLEGLQDLVQTFPARLAVSALLPDSSTGYSTDSFNLSL